MILSLGSNIGDKKENIKNAVNALSKKGLVLNRVSSFYNTEPLEFRDQEDFINIAVSGTYTASPEDLLKVIIEIEEEMGRKRVIRNGPRIIDIDIILFGGLQIEKEKLKIPHPEFRKRKFVLLPVTEIDPKAVDPVTGSTISLLYKKCTDDSKVKKEEKLYEV
ncbi:MAG: 2-amino-4-hydroxy-6-hydroxymethyldihydropteridine diphosphokinase [Candidatus Delongbacteria bacterium]